MGAERQNRQGESPPMVLNELATANWCMTNPFGAVS